MKIEFGDRDSVVSMLVLFMQAGLAFFGGIFAAGSVLPADSQWTIAGGVGALAGVMLGYAVALGLATLLAPFFAAKWAVKYARHRDLATAMRPGRADRVGFGLVLALAVATILACCFATALLLWLAGDAGAFATLWRFLLLGSVLAALVPKALLAF